MNFGLRDYQQRALDQSIEAFRTHRAVLLVMPTGAGKTHTFAAAVDRVYRRGRSAMILEHRKELISQASEKLSSFGISHGIIAPGHVQTRDRIQVASVQTLVRRLGSVPPMDLIVIDEAHHATAGSWRKILERFPTARLLGVTATPIRLDGAGLGVSQGGFFETIISGPSTRELIELGHLSRYRIYGGAHQVDLSGTHMLGGDYNSRELAEAVEKSQIIGDAVTQYTRHCQGVPALAFCCRIDHAQTVCEQFLAAGYRAATLDSTTDPEQRKNRIAALADGRLHVLCTVDIVSEGTDIPVVQAAICLRPTASLGLCLQQWGRVLRPYPGKDFAYILDHVQNHKRHGYPDDERVWSLDAEKQTGKSKAGEKTERFYQCKNMECFAIFEAWRRACPQCGAVRETMPREIEQVEGELVEITEEQREEERMRMQQRYEQGKARTLSALEYVLKQQGRNPAQAVYIMRGREKKEARKKADARAANLREIGAYHRLPVEEVEAVIRSDLPLKEAVRKLLDMAGVPGEMVAA